MLGYRRSSKLMRPYLHKAPKPRSKGKKSELSKEYISDDDDDKPKSPEKVWHRLQRNVLI